MILTVTLNLAIDKVALVKRFKRGEINRIKLVSSLPGGKGVNVARAIKSLGGTVSTTGFKGGFNGRFIEESLVREGINPIFQEIKEENRVCLIIIQEDGIITEIYEEGPLINEMIYSDYLRFFKDISSLFDYFVFSGSLATGLPDGYVRNLIEDLDGKMIFLDLTGKPLLETLKNGNIFLLKLNKKEFMDSFMVKKNDLDDTLKDISNRYKIPNICLTMGKEGALLFNNNYLYKISTDYTVPVVNPVGTGDSFLGSLVYFLSLNESLFEACKKALAASMSNVTLYEGGRVNLNYFQNILASTYIEEVKNYKK